MSEELLPLFPLNVVLFPDALLPLHIFEDRYKALIAECVRENSEFGINLVQEHRVSDVGCSARVAEVVHRYEDGRMDIIVEGRRRFRLLGYETDPRLFDVGRVTVLTPAPGEVDAALVRETRDLYNKLVAVVYRGSVEELSPGDARCELSFVMAQKAGLDLATRQHLLEQDSENDRLRTLHRYLADVLPRLSKLDEIQRIIGSDGYIQSP